MWYGNGRGTESLVCTDDDRFFESNQSFFFSSSSLISDPSTFVSLPLHDDGDYDRCDCHSVAVVDGRGIIIKMWSSIQSPDESVEAFAKLVVQTKGVPDIIGSDLCLSQYFPDYNTEFSHSDRLYKISILISETLSLSTTCK